MNKTELIETLKSLGYTVEEKTVTKVNERKEALIVSKNEIGITLYPEHLLSEMSEVIEMVEKQFNEIRNDVVKSFGNRDYILSHVRCRMVNKERNADLLADAPHIDFLDLAVIFEVDTTEFTREPSAGIIRNGLMSAAGLTVDELYSHAMENETIAYDSIMNFLMGYKVETLESATALFVTKPDKLYGATAILHNEVLAEIAKLKDDDLIIFPSSVHEIIVIPANTGVESSAMREMVSTINATEVRPEDFLSNSVYYYDRASNTVEFE